jgi:hypothetical protein
MSAEDHPGAYDVDWNQTYLQLVRKPAFLILVAGIVAQAAISEFGTAWPGYHAAHLVLALTDAFSGLRIATWSPPRQPWGNDKRIANGLPPLVSAPVEKSIELVLPPPLPPSAEGEPVPTK